jgi:hypothetical protein
MSTALTTRPDTGFLIIDTFEQAKSVAEYINKSALVPDAYRGKPADIVIAMQYGMELGLSPMQALQSVAVINGKPSIYGDALPAVVMLHPDFEDLDAPEPTGSNPDEWVAPCTVKRRGRAPVTRTFSTADAKAAGLWKKPGPWTNYPKRMLMMRARAFALRDAFPDRMKGLTTVEEAIDITPAAPPPSEPRRLSESAPATSTPSPQVDASAPAPSASHPDAAPPAPSAPAAASAPSVSTGTQLTNGVRIADTKVAVDPKTKQTTYEVHAKKNNAVVVFLTHDKALYDEAASCDGTDHLFTISYTRGRHRDAPALIMTGITLEERDDATPHPEQGTLPTEGA